MLLRRSWPLALLLACSGPSPSDGGGAGLDAAGDAGLDASARPDAGRDAGSDAGRDGGPDDPRWAPWVTLEECTFERAANPAGAIEVGWEPCPEGMGPPGCLQPTQRDLQSSFGWFDEGRGYFQLTMVDGREHTILLVSVGGPTLGAWRYLIGRDNYTCAVRLGLGGGHLGVVATYVNVDPRLGLEHVFHGPIDTVDELSTPVAIIAPGVQPQTVAVSEEVIAFWTGGQAVAVDPASGRVVLLHEPLAGIPQNVQVVGAHVLWEDWAELVRVAHADLGTAATIFRRADPGDVKGFHTDGLDFAWLEGFDRQPDGRYARLELWTAPYTRDPAALEPRMVRAMEVHGAGAYGGGWYVLHRGDPRGYEIIDVRDGTRRWWYAPVGQDPLYVSEHEILAPGLVRFDPHELPVAD